MDVQKIVVTLSEPDVVIEPGHDARLTVTMTNNQPSADRLLLEVEGIDIEWYYIPVPAVNVGPGAQSEGRINFKVARASENRAGSYPFLVRVMAMETGEVGVAQAMLVVKAYDSLQMELDPKRAVATFFNPINEFEVTVTNQGNAEETLDLFADDSDDGCAYEFDTDRITLKPGQSETILMGARPKVASVLGGVRLYSFKATARSTEDSYVSATAHGQIEKRALISPLLGIFLLLLAFGGAGYLLLRPTPLTPVKLEKFEATATVVRAGEPVKLTWLVTGDRPTIRLKQRRGVEGVDVYEPEEKPIGNVVMTPEPPQTIYTLQVIGPNGRTINKEIKVDVIPAPPAPKPTIKAFTADPTAIHAGDPVILSWQAKSAESYIIDPGGITLSRFEDSTTVKPDSNVKYTLRAIGKGDSAPVATKSVAIRVVPRDASLAIIDRFVASVPAYVNEKVHLKWRTRYAKSVKIISDKGEQILAGGPPNGTCDVTLTSDTKYTLTALDSLGNATNQDLMITPKAPPSPLPAPPTTDPNAPSSPPANPTDPNAPTQTPTNPTPGGAQ